VSAFFFSSHLLKIKNYFITNIFVLHSPQATGILLVLYLLLLINLKSEMESAVEMLLENALAIHVEKRQVQCDRVWLYNYGYLKAMGDMALGLPYEKNETFVDTVARDSAAGSRNR